MKLTIMVEIIVLCLMLTLFTVFTLDSASYRKAELLSILSTDVNNVCDKYFEGEISSIGFLQKELEDAISYSISGNTEDIDVSIYEADRKQGVIEIVVEVTYKQPTGQSKTITMERIYRDT